MKSGNACLIGCRLIQLICRRRVLAAILARVSVCIKSIAAGTRLLQRFHRLRLLSPYVPNLFALVGNRQRHLCFKPNLSGSKLNLHRPLINYLKEPILQFTVNRHGIPNHWSRNIQIHCKKVCVICVICGPNPVP